MDRENELPIYKYVVEWKIYDGAGNEIDRGSKAFERKSQAKEFARKVKRNTRRENNAVIVIRELDTNEIVERFKKKYGNKNFRRR
jgi:hypothetical protein